MSGCGQLAKAAGALRSGVMTRGGRRLGAWMACVTIPLVVVASACSSSGSNGGSDAGGSIARAASPFTLGTGSLVQADSLGNTVIGGESIEGLKFPSAAQSGIKIKLAGGPVDVEDGETSTLVVKFDVSRSFVMRGATIDQNGLLFTPVIRGTQQ